jgi:hypothetical protein
MGNLKTIMTMLFFIGITATSFSQELSGNWYMVNKSGLLEMNFSEDSITHRKFFTDLTPENDGVSSFQLIKTVHFDDRILLIIRSKGDTTSYSSMTLISFSENRYFQMAWNAPDTTSSNIDSLIEMHSRDQRKLYGYNFFSEDYLDSLNSMKTIEEMPLQDFRKFIRQFVDRIKMTRKEFEKINVGYAAIVYDFQLLTQSLYTIGYNPLQNSGTVDPLMKKYFDDLEVQSILNELKK